ncbi:YciI family protein [Actinorugispora endophytica]|uniref:YCII-related domain-containing protein n=1 Tax=Actinorugispora endophytica TaxID=1605990 RepID=A0A4R6V898_9ACTN|nr:YciI family protein [Actinorugispora endophytica]TDQ55366.1 hypothetical protein EV190_101692 [Actinorugispora endophytica]
MRFMMLFTVDESVPAPAPTSEMFAEMGKYNEAMSKAGVLLAGEGLLPSAKGARVVFSEEGRTVVDGPFTESKELVGGFWLIQVKTREEAVEWATRAPFGPGVVLEVRQVVEVSDFPADVIDPAIIEREREMRAEAAERAAAARP